MVHWGPLTPEQREVFPVMELNAVASSFTVKAAQTTELLKTEPTEPNMTDIDEKYWSLVENNIPLYEKLREQRLQPLSLD